MQTRFWIVRLRGYEVDRVPFCVDMEAADVYASLVDHDAYNPEITVELENSNTEEE